jgi:soluble lytic murein transglycosylase-like protein
MKKHIVIIVIVAILLIIVSKKSESDFKISQATVNRVNKFQSIITNASQSHGIPEKRIKAHIAVESSGKPNANGSAGEIGLMQMKPGALQDVNKKYLSNTPLKMIDLYEPGYSVACGTAYLKILLNQLGTLDKASMGYQSGAGKIDSSDAKVYIFKILTAEKLF